MSKPPTQKTVGELRESGWQSRSIRNELRTNLVQKLRAGEQTFPNLHGYEQTVIPQVQNAILAGHDLLLLGERGQAKSRLARSLVSLLDDWMPAIAGTDTNDDPFQPVSATGRAQVAELSDATPITWISNADRFAEKLATPDTSIADLIGEVDPIKIAEGRYLSNEEVISFGLIPRTNRGIFNLNELPDLSERIQVGLLNILEERDVQIRGFTIRLPLDILVVASANPEDYTNRGRIITPLKDRFGSQVRTHYPITIEHELRIVDQEQTVGTVEGIDVFVPDFMRELVASISHVARRHPKINTRSGVSVRMTIANYEAIVANALRRSVLTSETVAVPGILDLPALAPSMMGKIEFDTWEDSDDARVVEDILNDAIRQVGQSLGEAEWVSTLLTKLKTGATIRLDPMEPASRQLEQFADDSDVFEKAADFAGNTSQPATVSAISFALEYLHRSGQISKHNGVYASL